MEYQKLSDFAVLRRGEPYLRCGNYGEDFETDDAFAKWQRLPDPLRTKVLAWADGGCDFVEVYTTDNDVWTNDYYAICVKDGLVHDVLRSSDEFMQVVVDDAERELIALKDDRFKAMHRASSSDWFLLAIVICIVGWLVGNQVLWLAGLIAVAVAVVYIGTVFGRINEHRELSRALDAWNAM